MRPAPPTLSSTFRTKTCTVHLNARDVADYLWFKYGPDSIGEMRGVLRVHRSECRRNGYPAPRPEAQNAQILKCSALCRRRPPLSSPERTLRRQAPETVVAASAPPADKGISKLQQALMDHSKRQTSATRQFLSPAHRSSQRGYRRELLTTKHAARCFKRSLSPESPSRSRTSSLLVSLTSPESLGYCQTRAKGAWHHSAQASRA